MKLKTIILAIFLVFPLASSFAKDKKPKLDERVERLEALSEFLLTWPALQSGNGATSAANCGLTVDLDLTVIDPDWGFATMIARDTVPPSNSGPFSGTLKNLGNEGCDPNLIPPAGSPTDILAISRGACFFVDKVQNAADKGYGAVIIYNTNVDPFNFEGQLLVSMGGPEDSSYALPTVAVNARDGIDLPFIEGALVTINGPAEFCTNNE